MVMEMVMVVVRVVVSEEVTGDDDGGDGCFRGGDWGHVFMSSS